MENNFDNQPVIKDDRYKTITVVGFMKVVNHKGDLVSAIPTAEIQLTVGWQNNNRQLSGEGINHIYKHFSELPNLYYIYNLDKTINYLESIIHFTKSYFADLIGRNSIKVYIEDNLDKPILLKTNMGKMVVRYDKKKRCFIVVTCYRGQVQGKLVGNLTV